MAISVLAVNFTVALGGCGGGGSGRGGTGPTDIAAVSVSSPGASLAVGQSLQLAAIATGLNGQVVNGPPPSWGSSNLAIAVVSSSGLVTGVAPGPVSITATISNRSGSAGLQVLAPPAGGWSQITTSWAHSCGLASGGRAYCWGSNTYGQLGNGNRATSLVPSPVLGGPTFASISAGPWWTCGLSTTGAAFCWGWVATNDPANAYSETCTSATCANTPIPVRGSLTFTSLSTGNSFACGISVAGVAYCWGRNAFGMLGTGSVVSSLDPVPVGGGLRFRSLDVGFNEACGLLDDGRAYCWGLNDYGQLGTPATHTCSGLPCALWPLPVQTNLRFVSIDVGERHTCAVAADGQAYCWGYNSTGQLGNGTTASTLVPTPVAGGLRFRSVAAGHGHGITHSCGVTTSGAAYCWGFNNVGQLGNGSRVSSTVPTPVVAPPMFTSIAAAASAPGSSGSHPHTCGIRSDGGAYCWGDNGAGQLGTGDIQGATTPARVLSP